MMNTERYHVPYSQVWQGSRSGQAGKVHLHLGEDLKVGRLKRAAGQALCGRRGWYEREPDGEERCPRCVVMASRYKIGWP